MSKIKKEDGELNLFPEYPRKPKPKRAESVQQRILLDFAATWEQHVGRQYLIQWGKDFKWVNALIEMRITPDEYVARKNVFFADRKWWEFGKWDFAVFVKHINKMVVQASPARTGRALEDMMDTCVEHGIEHRMMEQCPECHKESEAIMKKMRGEN